MPAPGTGQERCQLVLLLTLTVSPTDLQPSTAGDAPVDGGVRHARPARARHGARTVPCRTTLLSICSVHCQRDVQSSVWVAGHRSCLPPERSLRRLLPRSTFHSSPRFQSQMLHISDGYRYNFAATSELHGPIMPAHCLSPVPNRTPFQVSTWTSVSVNNL